MVMRSASETALPVRGVPVATVAVGQAGAAKAGILAAHIIATGNPDVAARLKPYKAVLPAPVERAADVWQRRLQGP
jgi:phosphoribosylcarboxyaminoimidazole (NCAIR) mutase